MKAIARFMAVVVLFNCGSVAAQMYWAGDGHPLNVRGDVAEWSAPGEWSSIRISDKTAHLTLGRSVFQIGGIYTNPLLSEVGYSSDIRGVFVNASDGGDEGTWGTQAFVEVSGKPLESVLGPRTASILSTDPNR